MLSHMVQHDLDTLEVCHVYRSSPFYPTYAHDFATIDAALQQEVSESEC